MKPTQPPPTPLTSALDPAAVGTATTGRAAAARTIASNTRMLSPPFTRGPNYSIVMLPTARTRPADCSKPPCARCKSRVFICNSLLPKKSTGTLDALVRLPSGAAGAPRVAKHVPAQAPPAGRGGWVLRRANARAFFKLSKLRCWRAKPPSAARQGEWRPARTSEIVTCREVGRGRKIWRQNHGAAAIGHGTRNAPASIP